MVGDIALVLAIEFWQSSCFMALNQVDRVDCAVLYTEACRNGFFKDWTNDENLVEVSHYPMAALHQETVDSIDF